MGHNIQDIAQIRPLCANTKVVQHYITLGVGELSTTGFFRQGVLNGIEVLVTASRSSFALERQ